MAGLDTRGLASGFAQGFGLMDQHQRGQRAEKRADQQMGMQQERMDMQREQFGAQQEDAQRARDMEELQFTLGKIGSGMDVDESELELLQRYPKFWAALDPQTDHSIEQAMAVIDPDTPVDANDPESLEALNQMFGAEINRGDGGQKRVVGMVPAPDGQSVMLELEVAGEDGSTYRAPMTEGRGTGDDDLVMAVPVERLVEQVQGMRVLRNTMQTPEAQQRASQVLQLLQGGPGEQWETIEGPGGSLLRRNINTGKTESVVGRAPAGRAGGSGGAPTATMKEAEWMVAQGIAPDIPTAFETLRQSRGDDLQRDRLELSALDSEMNRLNRRLESGWLNDDEREPLEREMEALRAQRDQVAQRVFNRPEEQGGGQPQPEPEADPDAPVQVETDDDFHNLPSGTLFVGPDGVTRRKP